ncbi:MAG: hypothetical protein ACKVTZ_05465 [Bacteroidia bacterium]
MNNITGNENIVIQNVTGSSITVNVNGQIETIERKLEAILAYFAQFAAQNMQVANKIYNIGTITNANFDFVLEQLNYQKQFPAHLAQNLSQNAQLGWVTSLKQSLSKQKVAVGSRPMDIFTHYGWLIETFLQKMCTDIGQEKSLRAFSFMTECYHASLRYLCYIQIAQLLHQATSLNNKQIQDFLNLSPESQLNFDYLNLLILSTSLLSQAQEFVPEIRTFTENFSDTQSDVFEVALFLDNYRDELLQNKLLSHENLAQLLEEYRTALVYWLREMAFVAKYRLVSIKDIQLNYRLGTAKVFVHSYGELHGIYDAATMGEDYTNYEVQDTFTYNHSVLLFAGTNIADCLEKMYQEQNYLSLSPLLIDQSVFAEKSKQTPEIYYYIGSNKREYHFALYKNEVDSENPQKEPNSNKKLVVKRQNNNQPKLDELFEHLGNVWVGKSEHKP